MRILEALGKNAIIHDLKGKDKKAVLEELVLPLVETIGVDQETLVKVLIERERLGSTGIGGGVGIPHGKLDGLASIALGFGLSRSGVDFESMDGKPTHIFFLLLTPENSTGLHLKLLARISRLLKKDPFKEKLLQAQDIDEIYHIIKAEDVDFYPAYFMTVFGKQAQTIIAGFGTDVGTNKIFIVTGRSGSGKSTAIAAFEDAGFYCVDNMPVVLLPHFLDLPRENASEITGFAFVMDLREKGFLAGYNQVFRSLEEKGFVFEIIFLEADENVLLQRYSQTRRNHPLSDGRDLLEGVRAEEQALSDLKKDADILIDTSHYTVHELKSFIFNIVKENAKVAPIKINVLSFGYKYGIPHHADLIIDVRFLPNPYFITDLKELDGESEAVQAFLSGKAETINFLKKYLDLLDYLIPLYEKEGKTYLTIGVGCTGGRHRSVFIAKMIFTHVAQNGRDVNLAHRDVATETKTGS